MTLPYSKKQRDHARETGVPMFQVNFDFRYAKGAGIGLIRRNGLLTKKTVDAIMKLIDKDPAGKSAEQLAALEKRG